MTRFLSFLAWPGASAARRAPATRVAAISTHVRRLGPNRGMDILLWRPRTGALRGPLQMARQVLSREPRVAVPGERQAPVGLGGAVPAERGVLRGRVRVAVEPLQRLGLGDGPGAGAPEQPIDRPHAQPGDQGLCPTGARA